MTPREINYIIRHKRFPIQPMHVLSIMFFYCCVAAFFYCSYFYGKAFNNLAMSVVAALTVISVQLLFFILPGLKRKLSFSSITTNVSTARNIMDVAEFLDKAGIQFNRYKNVFYFNYKADKAALPLAICIVCTNGRILINKKTGKDFIITDFGKLEYINFKLHLSYYLKNIESNQTWDFGKVVFKNIFRASDFHRGYEMLN